jgi:EAL domain-containing protein (putative c-di-GMP-specific phosphodiesterase class I)
MAFQPIVDLTTQSVFAYESLVRGLNGESASTILSQITEQNRYAFDQQCRVKAITLAAQLGLAETGAFLSINFMPGAVYSPAACIRKTLETASEVNFPLDRLIFELTEDDRIADIEHLKGIVREYHKHGFRIAIDDFGAGYSGLNLLASFTPDILKLDMGLTRDIHLRPQAAKLLRHLVAVAESFGCLLVAEGIENEEELAVTRECGVNLVQGYYFAKPGFETLPSIRSFSPLFLQSNASFPAEKA